MNKVTEIKSKLTFKDVQKAAEEEVLKENLEKYKKDYKELLKKKENAEQIVRNIDREIEELEERFSE